MELPVVDLPRTSLEVGGNVYEIRSLTRKESRHAQVAFHVADVGDLADVEAKATAAEVYILACGLDVAVEVAEAWSAVTDSPTVEAVVEAIMVLSALKEGEPSPKSGTSEP